LTNLISSLIANLPVALAVPQALLAKLKSSTLDKFLICLNRVLKSPNIDA
jgi:hypothetical protein